MKKIWAIPLILIIFLLSLFGTYYYYSKPNIIAPISTGGDKTQFIPNEYDAELKSMEQIAKLLPIKTPYFVITFNYKKGKYIVTNLNSSSLESDFTKWYDHSGFKDIPKSRFVLSE